MMIKSILFTTLLMAGLCSWSPEARAITLFPATLKMATSGDQPQTHTIRVFNESKYPIQVTPFLKDWTDNGKGQKIFYDPGKIPFGLGAYTQLNDSLPFVLQSRESRLISLTVKVPSGKLGGHHGIVMFQASPYEPAPQKNPAKVKMSVRLGTTLLQEDSQSARISSRISACDILPAKQELKVQLKVSNEGNTYLQASGVVAIMDHQDNFLGTFKIPNRTVLRGESAQLVGSWRHKLKPGKYQALVTYQYREQSITVTRNFVIS